MNPLTKMKLINKLNDAWIFLGGLPYELTEGDIVCKTGKSKGFCFLCYKGQRSTILAIDNFNGIKMKGRTIRVDHVSNYRTPKDSEEMDDVTKKLQEKGCGAYPLTNTKMTKRKKKKKKEKEKTDQEVQAEQPSSSSPRCKTIKEKDDPGPKNSKNSETAQKSEPREGPKLSKARTAYSGGAEDLERDLEKEKPKHEHKSSSRREAREEKTRNRDRGRSPDTHSSQYNGHTEGCSRSSKSRSQISLMCALSLRKSGNPSS
uniref:RRM domain-containing protein n=1 Tax=Macaca nemestrina TaxID=9545 RepID=A0A2K6B7K4_MACNE